MIEEKDIKLLLSAKKDNLAINILMTLSVVSLIVLIFLEVTQINDDYTIILATVSAVLMGSSAGVNKWVSVSRADLIETIERIVQKDANGLKLLAMHRGKIKNQAL